MTNLTNNLNKYYVVYRMDYAQKLQALGFPIVNVGVNFKYPKYKTFIFSNTPEFRKAFTSLIVNK